MLSPITPATGYQDCSSSSQAYASSISASAGQSFGEVQQDLCCPASPSAKRTASWKSLHLASFVIDETVSPTSTNLLACCISIRMWTTAVAFRWPECPSDNRTASISTRNQHLQSDPGGAVKQPVLLTTSSVRRDLFRSNCPRLGNAIICSGNTAADPRPDSAVGPDSARRPGGQQTSEV